MRGGRWLVTLPAAIIGYSYVGYPLAIGAAAAMSQERRRSKSRPVSLDAGLPSVTIVVAAYNEEAVIQAKIDDVRAQDYPADLVRILVVADGSTDRTVELARAKGVDVIFEPARRGKCAAVNRAMEASDTEIVCLTDANCRLEPHALRAVVAPFSDPTVAVVSGAKTVLGSGSAGQGEGLYWKFESRLKKAESVFGAIPGAVGELCALRRVLVRPIPSGVINDDFHLTCDALERGFKAKYVPEARAIEEMSATARDEFDRRVRVAAGTWQGVVNQRRLAHPRHGIVAWVYLSHRVFRSLIVPPLLPIWFLLSFWQRKTAVGRAALGGQVLMYAAAGAAVRSPSRLLAAPYAFVSMNLATLLGGVRYVRKAQPVAWERARRGPVTDDAEPACSTPTLETSS
jgi:cellulose synthase/poly-beta-1,6-N-acetylglucosamine synthase-like glycosyltransferase